MPIITLTTDFGNADGFVGIMKGVILSINPHITCIDLAHDLRPGDIQSAAWILRRALPYFPAQTVHLAIVDPGVGGHRLPLAIRCTEGFLVGPDNGILSLASRDPRPVVRHAANPNYHRHPISNTFHGRDLFAPVAAHLATGSPFHRLGPRVPSWKRLADPQPVETPTGWLGEVVAIDRFGNAFTNFHTHLAPNQALSTGWVYAGTHRIAPILSHYGAVRPGESVAVFSSAHCLEIAVNGGSAALKHTLQPGTPLRVRFTPPQPARRRPRRSKASQ